jgi:hypothetical protein
MKQLTVGVAGILFCLLFAPNVLAVSWDRGPYFLANIGMMQLNNDAHVVTGNKFAKNMELAYGLSIGFDANSWWRPIFTANYATASATVGTATGAAGTFPAGTFPRESSRQHAIDITFGDRFTLPYFRRVVESHTVKFLPYAMIGGTFHALFVNAPSNANKVGALGGGPAVGGGFHVFLTKGFVVGLDFTEHLIIQKKFYVTILGQRTEVTQGGFKPRYNAMASLGWHF